MKMILFIFLLCVSTTPLILCDDVEYSVMYSNVELLTKIHELSKTIYKQINTNHEALKDNYLMMDAVSGDYSSAENDDYVSTRSGLTHDCNNKYCTMLMYLLVSKQDKLS